MKMEKKKLEIKNKDGKILEKWDANLLNKILAHIDLLKIHLKKNYNTYSQDPLLHGKIYVYSDNWINKRNIMPLEALLV